MSVIHAKDFHDRFCDWVDDPSISEEEKQELFKAGMGIFNASEGMDVNDLCFLCGEKLTFPYVYWNGSHGDIKGQAKGISLHAGCARHLAVAITKDAVRIETSNL